MELTHRKNVTTSQSHNMERNCRVFHVCQHLASDYRFFIDERIAMERMNCLGYYCRYYGVVVLHSVVMPNHTHDILYCNSYEDLAAALKSTNYSISRYIRRHVSGLPSDAAIFSSRPRYTPVKSIRQYYSEAFYLFSNPERGREEFCGFDARFSSFRILKEGCLPVGFDEEVYRELFGMSIWDYIELLGKPFPEYQGLVRRICMGFSKEKEMQVFKIRSSEPFTS